jgi:hypothetical protein
MGLMIGSLSHPGIGASAHQEDSVPNAPAALELHIEAVVLHGFPPSYRFRIGDALERELSRLIAQQGLAGLVAVPMAVEHLDAGAFKVPPNARPHAIGAQLAHSLHQRLSPPKAPAQSHDRITRNR